MDVVDVDVVDAVVVETIGGAVEPAVAIDDEVAMVEVGPSVSATDSPLLAVMKPTMDTTISNAPAPINMPGSHRGIEHSHSIPNLTRRPTGL